MAKNIPEYHLGVKQFGPRTGWILCPMFPNYLDDLLSVFMPPPFVMGGGGGGAYSITLFRTYVHPVRTKNGFRAISFEYIDVLE